MLLPAANKHELRWSTQLRLFICQLRLTGQPSKVGKRVYLQLRRDAAREQRGLSTQRRALFSFLILLPARKSLNAQLFVAIVTNCLVFFVFSPHAASIHTCSGSVCALQSERHWFWPLLNSSRENNPLGPSETAHFCCSRSSLKRCIDVSVPFRVLN